MAEEARCEAGEYVGRSYDFWNVEGIPQEPASAHLYDR
jgi:hypothetical protein